MLPGITPTIVGLPSLAIASSAQGLDGANVTSSPITMPAGIRPGDLVIVAMGCQVAAAISGWTLLGGTGSAQVFFKVADGTEGASVNATHASSTTRWAAMRIIGNKSNTPVITTSSGTSANPAPAAISPAWGANTSLFITMSDIQHTSGYTGKPSGTINVGSQIVFRSFSADYLKQATATYTPTSYTSSTSAGWATATVAVH